MSARLRRRIRDFVTVLGCRFPTIQDADAPKWTKATVRALASWRYRLRRYDKPWELDLWNKMARNWRLRDPRATGI
jgi:anaerobic magnesium-protoporphyrin IX monomethyl ester cyclase